MSRCVSAPCGLRTHLRAYLPRSVLEECAGCAARAFRVAIFGLGGNAVLDARVAETADNLRFHHAASSEVKLRTHTSFMYQANSWARPRKVVARLECSLQPDTGGEITSTGMRQEVDIRYVVTLAQRLGAASL
jgi:hypothetical protein